MANTRETMGEQACLDALVADTLTSLEDDGITKVGDYCLYLRKALTHVKLPACTSVGSYGFNGCTNLESVDIQGGGQISQSAFNDCAKLQHLVLRGSTMSSLPNPSAFTNTGIGNKNGAIYVQPSLLSAYENNSNWSSYLIRTLDEYPLSDFSTITESWSDIDSMVQAGTFSSKYAIGDTKLVDLGAQGKIYMQVAGFDCDDLADGSGKAKVTFVCREILNDRHFMDLSISNYDTDWASSSMRSYLADTIMPLMPSDLQTMIKEVTKYSRGYIDKDTVDTDMETTDKLFLLSCKEMRLSNGNKETKGASYTLFNAANVSTNEKTRVKYNVTNNEADSWYLRTANSGSAYYTVGANGRLYTNNASTTSNGVVFGFCI